jgi:hypothetical protein
MASERQIAANRRNAEKSTGPRSRAGKKRGSKNALRHGLTLNLSGVALTEQAEELARRIAGDNADADALEHARAAAEAELDLARIRRVKLALIERVSVFGSLTTPRHFRSANDEVRWLIAMDIWIREEKRKGAGPPMPLLENPAATMPSSGPYRSAEAVRRLLPDLLKLDRYETRAVGRRDRAIRLLAKM